MCKVYSRVQAAELTEPTQKIHIYIQGKHSPLQVCQKLKDRNTELVEAGPRAAAVQAQHEQELRKLLTQAQEDIEKHRRLAATTEQEKQSLMDRVCV